jgi:hypothetical protein
MAKPKFTPEEVTEIRKKRLEGGRSYAHVPHPSQEPVLTDREKFAAKRRQIADKVIKMRADGASVHAVAAELQVSVGVVNRIRRDAALVVDRLRQDAALSEVT